MELIELFAKTEILLQLVLIKAKIFAQSMLEGKKKIYSVIKFQKNVESSFIWSKLKINYPVRPELCDWHKSATS